MGLRTSFLQAIQWPSVQFGMAGLAQGAAPGRGVRRERHAPHEAIEERHRYAFRNCTGLESGSEREEALVVLDGHADVEPGPARPRAVDRGRPPG